MKALVYETSGRAPWIVRNRYGRRTIGLAVKVGRRHLLSVVWRKP